MRRPCRRSRSSPPSSLRRRRTDGRGAGASPGAGPQAPGPEAPMPEDACRIDVWLWRARLCKTRGLGARLAESGRIRLTRAGQQTRLDKASRTLRAGDELVFAVAGRLTAIRIEALGLRRG